MAQMSTVIPQNMTAAQRKIYESQRINARQPIQPTLVSNNAIVSPVITEQTSVQKDALNLLNMINAKKQTLINKFGSKRITDIANGLLAITRLSNNDIKTAESKNANLKLITIKAQEILKGDEDTLLGNLGTQKDLVAKRSAGSMPKNFFPQGIEMLKKNLDYWKMYAGKFPKDIYAKNNLNTAQKEYNDYLATQKSYKNMNTLKDFNNTINPSAWNYSPTGAPKKIMSNPIKKPVASSAGSIMETLKNYLPYIIIGGVVLLLIFSQTKPRTPIGK